jgi:putative sigma-54 modulation protein
MEILVRNAEGNLSEANREYASKKLGKLDRYFNAASKVEMVHREERHDRRVGHRIEITVFADGLFVRGEEFDENLRAAIDKVAKKRLVDRHRRKGTPLPAALTEEERTEAESFETEVAERKRFSVKPMTLDEAALQLEMIDHPFFVFANQDTGGLEVLYRRRDGRYGILEPKT